ncbi:MAG: hypothetical protein IKN06_13760 [Bacteroidales bacterium]|jgi:hypothetical protein|nr:hypothetical protein [Bacteroidales bacterium]
MKKLLLWAALPLLLLSCAEKIHDPGKDNKGNQNPDELVAVKGFYTLEHEGFKFKIREEVYNTTAAQDAISHLKEDLTEINGLIPKSALDVMKKNPIWLEKDLTDGAAWYHSSKDWVEEQARTDSRYMVDKWHCVELCNYVHYVSWSDQNQPYMVLHELCHLYHDQALPGGFENPDVKAAYNAAMAAGKYVNTAYRLDKNTVIEHYDDYYHAKVYATTNQMEYFSEICEAYWGENDYYPFNYDDLKAYDPQGFAVMEKVWGPRENK